MKHIEYCQDLFTNYKDNIGDEYNEFYSDAFNKVFYRETSRFESKALLFQMNNQIIFQKNI